MPRRIVMTFFSDELGHFSDFSQVVIDARDYPAEVAWGVSACPLSL